MLLLNTYQCFKVVSQALTDFILELPSLVTGCSSLSCLHFEFPYHMEAVNSSVVCSGTALHTIIFCYVFCALCLLQIQADCSPANVLLVINSCTIIKDIIISVIIVLRLYSMTDVVSDLESKSDP